MAIPRIGHEVVVTFLEGDPDRPVITGRVYHGGNTPPYDLPEHKTRTVFRSRSTPDGKGPRGFNEFCIEDKAGEEEIYVRAEKDVNIHVKNDWKKHILRDRRQQVDNYDYTHIKGETHLSLKGQRKTELRSDDHLTINADSHVRIDQQWLLKAGTEIHVASGARILLEAGAELTVKAGGSWIKLDASGVSINGKKIYISGGGKAGTGTPARPLKPEEALFPGKTAFMPAPAKFPLVSAETSEFPPPPNTTVAFLKIEIFRQKNNKEKLQFSGVSYS